MTGLLQLRDQLKTALQRAFHFTARSAAVGLHSQKAVPQPVWPLALLAAEAKEGCREVVRQTRELAAQTTLSSDGRIRLRGRDTLDICATRARIPEAIAAFEQVLNFLEAEGIRTEIRCIDGWRNCAMVGDIPVPVRIRQRLHRVQRANSISVAIEHLLGGRFPEKLVPGDMLQFQIMRFGVSIQSFEIRGELTRAELQTICAAVRRSGEREDAHQRRMLAAALNRQRPAAVAASVPPAVPVAQETPAEPAALPVRDLIEALDVVMAQYSGSGRLPQSGVGVMSESVLNLATALGESAKAKPAPNVKVRRKARRNRCAAK